MSAPLQLPQREVARANGFAEARRARHPAAGLLLVLLCLVAWLPGLAALPPVDRDESRFLLAARNMAVSGEWWMPRLDDRPRLEKPPLATWLQAAALRLGTHGVPSPAELWLGRLPSLLAALGAVLVVWRGGGHLVDPRAAWLAALLLGLSPVVVWETHQARADLILLLPTTICLLALGEAWRQARRGGRTPVGQVVLFWLSLLGGVLAKGPITPWIVVATVLGLAAGEARENRWRWLARLRPGWGLLGLAAVLGLLLGLQSQTAGAEQLAATAYRETIGRVLTGVDGHWAPPGLHALLAPALLWPGSLGLLGGLAWSWRAARRRPPKCAARQHRFLLAWALPAWLGFEVAATKLPHYTLPLFVPLLLLSARWLLRLAARRPVAWPHGLRWPLVAWWALPGIALPIASGALAWLVVGSPTLTFVLAVVAVLPLAVAACRVRAHPIPGLVWALAAWILAAVAAGFLLPRWPAPWTAQRLAGAIATADPHARRPLADAAWGESSLPLLVGRPVERIERSAVTAWLAEHRDGMIVLAASDAEGLRILARVEGLDLVHARQVELVLADRGGPLARPASRRAGSRTSGATGSNGGVNDATPPQSVRRRSR